VAKFAAGVVDTGGNFAASFVDTRGKFASSVVDTGGAHWLANISKNFQKNLKRSKRHTLGLGGNWFMKKTRSKKSRDTVPLMGAACSLFLADHADSICPNPSSPIAFSTNLFFCGHVRKLEGNICNIKRPQGP
jgi:hypothetical protein